MGGKPDSPPSIPWPLHSPKHPLKFIQREGPGSPQIHMSNVRDATIIDPAPTITVHISSLNGSADMEILPDFGANISVPGKEARAAKGLSILPDCYPHPINTTLVSKEHPPAIRVNTLEASAMPTSKDIMKEMKEFPNDFDGQIRMGKNSTYH